MAEQQDMIILGGGIAGLAVGYELARRGYQVTVLEKNTHAGGLARTLVFDGYRFDIGGHRFHSNNEDVVNWLRDLMGADLLQVPRLSHIRMGEKYIRYPLQFPGALKTFDPLTAVQVLLSYAWAKIKPLQEPHHTFEDWVIHRFGRKLYEVYFKPYTEKVWGIPTTELSAMWAAQRISLPSLAATVMRALIPGRTPPPTIIDRFYYPREGFGMITDRLQEEIEARGGKVITDAAVTGVDPSSGMVTYTHDGAAHEVTGATIISTIPLSLLLRMLPAESGAPAVADSYELEYRDLIIVDLALKRDQVSTDSWTYFPDPKLIFGRTHEPKNWSAEMVPSPDVTSLAVEIFTTRGEPVWEMTDDAIIAKVVEQMNAIGWLNSSDFIKGWVLRVPYGYPVYRVGYQVHLQRVLDFLNRWDNLHLVGRTGSFKYMNSDGVIEDVFRLMGDLFPDEKQRVQALEKERERWA